MSSPNQRRAFAIFLAHELDETNREVQKIIQRLVDSKGNKFANKLYREALKIEARGGMLIENSSFRRTIGGVFFKLAKDRLTEQERRFIFTHTRAIKQQEREVWEQKLGYKAFDWDNRILIMQVLFSKKGKVDEVAITLKGRPSSIERRKGLLIMTMATRFDQITFPKGLPDISDRQTFYTVYVDSSQWDNANIDKRLENPEEVLIVHGVPMIDPVIEGITVFATEITTKPSKKVPPERAKGSE